MRFIRGEHDREGYLRIELTPADMSKLHHSGVLAGIESDGTRVTIVTDEEALATGQPFDEYGRELLPCSVCGEVTTPNGRTCRRCRASLEEDRLERESGR